MRSRLLPLVGWIAVPAVLFAQDPLPAPSFPSQPAAPSSPAVALTLGDAARLAARQSAAEIGRASCRERVCLAV